MNPNAENPLGDLLDEIEAETHADKKANTKDGEVLDVKGKIIKLNEEWGQRSEEDGEDLGRPDTYWLSDILPPEK